MTLATTNPPFPQSLSDTAGLALALLLTGMAGRLLLAAWLPLGVDEAYAIAAARQFSWSFHDHPPLGFWLPVAMAWLTGFEHALVYRLPFVALGTVTGWALWRIGTLLGGPRAGLATLILWLLAPHMVLGSGVLVVPDAPLDAAASVAMLILVTAMRHGPRRVPGLAAWLGFGAALAVAMLSKYHAVLLAVAVLGFFLTTPRWQHWLARPAPWLGAAVAVAGLVPVVIWNHQAEWPTLQFHGARTGGGLAPGNLALMTLGQMLYLLPPVLVLAVLGLIAALRRRGRQARGPDGMRGVLAWAALVPVAVFTLVYVFGTDTLPHWTMPGWLFALPLAGAWLTDAAPALRKRAWLWLWGSALVVWAALVVMAVHLTTGVLTRHLDTLPAWDRQSELVNLRPLAMSLTDHGWLDGVEALATPIWTHGGQLSTALSGQFPVTVLGPDRRHFAHQAPAPDGRWLLALIGEGAEDPGIAHAQVRVLASEAGRSISRAGTVPVMRGGRAYLPVRLYWLDPVAD